MVVKAPPAAPKWTTTPKAWPVRSWQPVSLLHIGKSDGMRAKFGKLQASGAVFALVMPIKQLQSCQATSSRLA